MDLIDRQAAIDALAKHEKSNGHNYTLFVDIVSECAEIIRDLPSAQPVQCEDAVSREKVKELAYSQIRNEYSGIALKEQRESMLRIADNVIGLLPSVTPKQRTGKWIRLDMHAHLADHKCTACGQECYVPTCMGEPMYAFCPNCGAKMEVEE